MPGAGDTEPAFLLVGQTVDQDGRCQHGNRRIDVTGQRNVALYFPELRRGDDRDGVFLTVDHTLLKGGEQLGEGHRCGCGTHFGERLHVHLVFHGAQFQTFQIRRGPNRTLRVGHMTEAIFGPRKADQLVFVDLGQQFLTDLAIQHRACVIVVTEQEGQVQRVNFGYKVAQRAGGGDHHVQRSDLQAFDHVTLAAQLPGGGLRAGEFATRQLFELGDEGIGSKAVVRCR